MNAETQREEELFDAARILTDRAARTALLERSCAGNAALRGRIEALLAASEEADIFFAETRTVMTLPGAALQFSASVMPPSDAARMNQPGEEPIGALIGRPMPDKYQHIALFPGCYPTIHKPISRAVD